MAHTRNLLPQEIALFPKTFTKEINIESVELISQPHNIFARNKILVRGHRIYWPNCPKDFTQETVQTQSILMHELCHVWQYHTYRLTALRYLANPKRWAYKYAFDILKKFDDYPTEKQADLMQDWYLANKGCAPANYDKKKCAPPTKDALNDITPFSWG